VAWAKTQLRAIRAHGVAVGMRQQSEKETDQGVLELPLEPFQDV
jgi:hypothetical protein